MSVSEPLWTLTQAAAEESIYALIPPPAPVVIKPPMHRSKYPHNTAPTMSTFGMSATATNMITNAGGEYEAAAPAHSHKHPCASMGPGASIPKDPHNFMRSRGADTLPERTPYLWVGWLVGWLVGWFAGLLLATVRCVW